jgi:hypothetical protein
LLSSTPEKSQNPTSNRLFKKKERPPQNPVPYINSKKHIEHNLGVTNGLVCVGTLLQR